MYILQSDIMGFLSSLFDEVLNLVENWNPTRQYSSEQAYRDDLIGFLREQFARPTLLGSQEQHSIQKEAGRSLADIGIDRKVAIEIKYNLKAKSDADRLIGQIKGYLNDYDKGVIVVLCGHTDRDKEDYVRGHLKDLPHTDFLGGGKRINVIIKKSDSR